MAHLSLNTLGEYQILIDGSPISSFESDKVRALLAYLAVESDRPHRRETLIGLLWPDCTEEAARHNLSQALFNLRLAVGDHTAKPPYLLISRDAIQFNRESDYSLDVDQFNDDFHGWEQDQNQNQENVDPSTLLLRPEDMVRLYRGEFLRGFSLGDTAAFEDWILVQRESMRQHTMDALAYLANENERRGDLQAARSHLSRQLELDAWREEVHYQLMHVLALDGQRSAALVQYENCRRVLAQELGVEPSAKTRDLYEQIRLSTFKGKDLPTAGAPTTPIHNLPAALTPFFGRERELAELKVLIQDPEVRCITLVGPGGIGKTRLALEAADQSTSGFAHGCSFVALASAATVGTVIPAIANAIHFAFHGPSEPKRQLINYLRGRQILLVVDNVEHLLAEDPHRGTIADLLMEILQGANQIKLLVTSREAMNLQGEWPFQVRGLSFPSTETADGLGEYEAVALFLQRARRAHPEFAVDQEEMPGVARLCRLVEGLPLAIELAATWVRLLSPGEIAAEIESNLDFLSAHTRDLPDRHKSMRAVFDHSWEVLSAEEKQVLSRLSVFRGGFQREAAEQVAGASLPVLSSLLIRSFLRRTASGRYDLHELIRQYAGSKLAEQLTEMQDAQERHSLFYLSLLEEQGVRLEGNRQKEAVTELTSEMDNIRAAWDWSIVNHEFIRLYKVSARLMYLCEVRNWFEEGENTFRKTADSMRVNVGGSGLDAAHQVALHALLAHSGYFRFRLGKGEEAYSILAPSAAFLRANAEHLPAIYSHFYLGIDCWILGKFSEAHESLVQSRALARKYGMQWYEAIDNEFLGIVATERGEYHQAQQYLSEALALLRQLGDPSMTAHALSYLSRTMQSLGEYREAGKLLQESMELSRENGYLFATSLALDGLGEIAYAERRYGEAQPFFSESTSLFRELGDTHHLSRTLNHQALNSVALGDASGALHDFQAALSMAREGGWIPTMLYALAGLAALATHQEGDEGTLALVCYILEHPASAQETKDIADRLRVELESRLAQDEIDTAHQSASSRSLDEFVGWALARSSD